MGNIVAIVGRPNVGKSTFFNRMTETRQAIVDEVSGVTRDRHYGKVIWNGHEFSIIDTGGYVTNSDDVFEEEIRKQVLLAIQESDVVIWNVEKFVKMLLNGSSVAFEMLFCPDNLIIRKSIQGFTNLGGCYMALSKL